MIAARFAVTMARDKTRCTSRLRAASERLSDADGCNVVP